MIYRVYLDGISIYDEGIELSLLNPSLTVELNTAGSFTFKMPVVHSYYNLPSMLTQTVEVYEEDELVWFGRPLDIKTDFLNRKEVYCEGALAFFNDSIQRPQTYDSILISEFFATLIANHNSQVPQNRRFVVGNVTIPDTYIYRKLDYISTFKCLMSMCVEAEGGYLFVRREDGTNYIDWVKDITMVGDQPAQFAVNILDLNQVMSGADIKTAVIPIGKSSGDNKLTIAPINQGLDYIDSEAVAIYGRITEVVEFDVTSREQLLEKGQQWLTDQQWDPLTIEVDVAELHYIQPEYDTFRVGQIIHCTSTPHLIDKNFPLLKLSLDLDTAKKKIAIGTTPRRTLTEILKSGETSEKYMEMNYD